MPNSTTDHSKMLRRQSAAASQAKLTASNRFEIRNQDAAKIAYIKAGLMDVPGSDNSEKLIFLIDFYNKHTK